MSSSAHVDNKKIYILILGKGPTQGLDNNTLTAENEYVINFSEQEKKVCLCLQCKGDNSHLCVNSVEIYKFKAKDSEINVVPNVWVMIQKKFN